MDGVYQTSVISYSLASRLMTAAVTTAEERGLALSFVILNSAGHLVASARMDGAAFITVEVARGKAFACAAAGGVAGTVMRQRFADTPNIWGNAAQLGFGAPVIPAQGAMPIFVEGAFVGAIGASGAPSQIDEDVIVEAIRKIGASPSA